MWRHEIIEVLGGLSILEKLSSSQEICLGDLNILHVASQLAAINLEGGLDLWKSFYIHATLAMVKVKFHSGSCVPEPGMNGTCRAMNIGFGVIEVSKLLRQCD